MPVLFVDIDDTLIRTVGTRRIPITVIVERVRELHAMGAELYAWSRGGAAYAREVTTELGLAGCFLGFLPKPDALIDDMPVEQWLLAVHHPNEAASLSAAEIVASATR